ncbi:hypothetical protein C8R45DRAFT_1099239 [Mycena sanguinolenta]|nr:hypothetical protein C8R45DRAFT_1099239 [Mycena sanguinolenta]
MAWAGIGSALVHLCHQKTAALITGVLCTVFYLTSVLILHITTPALFSLETFAATPRFPYRRKGSPATTGQIPGHLSNFLPLPLTFLPTVFENIFLTVGLHNGSMYDVRAVNEGSGHATVNGTGFNITCGYLPDIVLSPVQNTSTWYVSGPAIGQRWVIFHPTQPGIIVPINTTYFDTVLFYTTIPILDSADALGPTYSLVPPLYNATSSIQNFGCSQSRMNQTVIVDSQSRTALDLTPELEKTTSTYLAQCFPWPTYNSTRYWALYHGPTVPKMRLFMRLKTLYRRLSYSFGNIAPVQELMIGTADTEGNSITALTDASSVLDGTAFSERPFLLLGTATVNVVSAETRLNLSIIEVIAGLQMGVSFPIEGTGMLHSIWLYRNHRELERLLAQVEHPTDDHLRAAGMVRTTLLEVRSNESFWMVERESRPKPGGQES